MALKDSSPKYLVWLSRHAPASVSRFFHQSYDKRQRSGYWEKATGMDAFREVRLAKEPELSQRARQKPPP